MQKGANRIKMSKNKQKVSKWAKRSRNEQSWAKISKKEKKEQKGAYPEKTSKAVPTICLPDKTSKPVRLKKMSHKSVLTKRLLTLFLSKLSLTQVSNSDFLEVVERRKRITKSNFGAACICPLHHCPLYRSRLCRCCGRASGTTTYQRSDGKLQQARETGGFQVTSYKVVQPVKIIISGSENKSVNFDLFFSAGCQRVWCHCAQVWSHPSADYGCGQFPSLYQQLLMNNHDGDRC